MPPDFEDIRVEREGGTTWLVIDREEQGNAFRVQTVHEMLDALETARRDAECRVVVIAGAGDRFFCLGGDHDAGHDKNDPVHYGTYFPVADLYEMIDKHSKPVIAMVNGFAVGGGNVLAAVCDMTIASTKAVFRQVGPSMGSFDAGFGTWYLEAAIGRKRAKEFWYLNRKYSAAEALDMGLVNELVEPEKLRARVGEIAEELANRGPIAISALKASFHAMHAGAPGLSRVALDLLVHQYYRTEESHELARAFEAREKPDKDKFYR